MNTVDALTATILAAATKLPLEWFVLGGSFLEEVVSPIPTYAIMVTTGSVARLQHEPWAWLLLLAMLGAIGKTLAACIYFALANLFESAIVPRYGVYIGIHQRDLEAIGKKLAGRRADHWLLVAVRVIPVLPSVPISIVAGLIKVPTRLFLWTTYLGTFIKNTVYLTIGYFGFRTFETMLGETVFLERVFEIGLAISVGVFLGWILWSKQRK